MATYDDSLGNGYILRLAVGNSAPDVGNNRTYVTWNLKLIQGGSLQANSSYNNPWSVTINGSYYSGTKQYNFFNYDTLLLASGGQWVTHNSNGSKSINVKSMFNDVYDVYLHDGSTNDTYTLPTIPRKSKPTVSPQPVDAGSTLTVYTNRASSSFTHQVQWFFGNQSGTPISGGVTTSYNWAVPMSLLSEFPNSLSSTGTIRLLTYDGSGSYIGFEDTVFTVRAPSSATPSVGSISVSEGTSGVASNIGRFVRNVSRFNINVSGSSGIYGSSIVSTRIRVAGQTINSSSGTTGPINDSGSVGVQVTVTDSRGRTDVKTQNVSVLNYSVPKINSMSVQRALSSGSPDENGTYLRVNFNASVTSLVNGTQRNSLRRIIAAAPHDSSSYTTESNVLQGSGSITFSSYVTIGTFAISNAYDVRLQIRDDFNTTTTIRAVPTAKIAMHWDGNDGVGVGKYRERGMLDVGGDIYATGSIGSERAMYLGTTNLNSVPFDGPWVQSANAQALASRNYPGGGGTAGHLYQATYGSMVYQTYQEYNSSSHYFHRQKYGSTWYGWVRVLTDNSLSSYYSSVFDARTGTKHDSIMTPARVANAIDWQVPSMINSEINNLPRVFTGRYYGGVGTMSGHSGADFSVSYGITVSPAPLVIAQSEQSAILVAVDNRTTTGFSGRLYNTHSAGITPGYLTYIAVSGG